MEKVVKLTAKQQTFVEEYLVDLNATQAAIRAGYSKKTAYSQGQRLLKNVEIQGAIQRAMEKRCERTQIDADWLLHETKNLYLECRKEGDRAQANRSLEIIGKHVDVMAFKNRIEVETTITQLSDEELDIRIKELSSDLDL